MLPITFPINVYACSGNNKTEPIYPPQSWVKDQQITLPICGGNPGKRGMARLDSNGWWHF